MYKTVQLFTSLITTKTSKFTSVKVIKNTCAHICTNTKVVKNAQLIKASIKLKLFIVLGLMIYRALFTDIFKFLFFNLNHRMTSHNCHSDNVQNFLLITLDLHLKFGQG